MANFRFNEHIIDDVTLKWDNSKNHLYSVIPFDYIVSNMDELNDALNQINTKGIGGCIYIKAGFYQPTQSIDLPPVSNITLYSMGGAKFLKPSGYPLFTFSLANSNLKFINLYIDNQLTYYETEPLFQSNDNYGGAPMYIENCYFFMPRNIYYGGFWGFYFLNNFIEGGTGTVVYLSGSDYPLANYVNCTIKNNQFNWYYGTDAESTFKILQAINISTNKYNDSIIIENNYLRWGHGLSKIIEISLCTGFFKFNSNIQIFNNIFLTYNNYPSNPLIYFNNLEEASQKDISIKNNKFFLELPYGSNIPPLPKEKCSNILDSSEDENQSVIFEHNKITTFYYDWR